MRHSQVWAYFPLQVVANHHFRTIGHEFALCKSCATRPFPKCPVALLCGVDRKDSRICGTEDQTIRCLTSTTSPRPHRVALNPLFDALPRAMTQPLGPTVAPLHSPPILVITGTWSDSNMSNMWLVLHDNWSLQCNAVLGSTWPLCPTLQLHRRTLML